MSDLGQRALLPAGLRDILPPEAQLESATVERLMAAFAAQGYERVKPPLVEFEDSLLSGSGAAMRPHTFRLMDPVSQRMMGLRADMTLQVARIATTRLGNAPRPLRLCYAGQVLRVKGDEMRPERQFGQVGAELIGSDLASADAESVLLAAGAVEALGVRALSVDLSAPALVPALTAGLNLAEEPARRLRDALDHKDRAVVARLGGAAAGTLDALLRVAGPADSALEQLARIALPPAAAAEAQRLADVVGLIRAALPELGLTIDPVENRGFEYDTGLCFTLFADGVRGELGRGGRYRAGEALDPGRGESAIGFTLFTDTLLQAVPDSPAPRRVFLPYGTAVATGARLRAEGWITLAALAPADDSMAEARRLGCSHALVAGAPVPAHY
jgi:ATP phosphoribosyltransferase regulatory subunit